MLGAAGHFGLIERAIGADMVADLAAEQAIDRRIGGLAGNVPERMFDGADGSAEGLEAAADADAAHDALDVARILADDPVLELQNLRLDIGLGRLDLAPAGDPFIGGDADDGAAGNDSAFEISNFQSGTLLKILPIQRLTLDSGFRRSGRMLQRAERPIGGTP